MTTKLMLTIFGAILGLQGLGLFFGAEAVTTQAFAAMNPDETGIAIGTKMHEVVGVMNLAIALILFASRNLNPAAGAKVLFGACGGLAVVLAHGFYNLFATDSKPPIPLLAIMSLMVILGLVTASKASKAE